MPSQKNIQLLREVKDRVNRSQAVFFAEYQKITHKQLEEVRNVLHNTNAELSISKNNLVNIALSEKNIDAREKLQGQLASFFAYEDPIATAKTVFAFFKKNSEIGKIKFGIYEGKVIDSKQLFELSNLPSREILLGKLAGLLESPMRGLVSNLNWTISRFVKTLKAVEEKKEVLN